MHSVAYVVLPPGDTTSIEAELAEAMEPWREEQNHDGEWVSVPEGWWDWYKIGGRWDGGIGGKNIATPLEALADHPPAQPDDPRDWDLPWHVLAGEVLLHRRFYHDDKPYPDCFEWNMQFPEQFRRVLESVHPESRVVLVDTHS